MKKWLIFLLLSLAVFWIAFGPLGCSLSDLWSACFSWFAPPGLLGAMWTVIVTILGLLPQILILFSYFYFLENTGLGFPLYIIMGFGCTTVAASTITNKRAAVMLSFIPCSAKAPVILLLGGVLQLNFLLVFLLYLSSVLTGVIASSFFGKTQNHAPNALHQHTNKRFLVSVLSNVCVFFRRIFGAVLIAAAILYFLKTYTFGLTLAQTFNQSMLSWVCSIISPLFIPLGLGNPAVIAALAFGILGKELAAATIAVFMPSTSLILSTAAPFGFTTASLIAFLVFFMLYPPCVTAIRAIAVQTNRKTAVLSVALNLTIAYAAAFVVYIIGITVF